ncbi:hypothetical protein LCGC14_0478540 [marine sediment metagenome]|uniref:Uncharacterized protein n=1 Tax=marine sediment metagenome TaxID=412755 RepID=A0A0F9S9Y2_9ZZZZ
MELNEIEEFANRYIGCRIKDHPDKSLVSRRIIALLFNLPLARVDIMGSLSRNAGCFWFLVNGGSNLGKYAGYPDLNWIKFPLHETINKTPYAEAYLQEVSIDKVVLLSEIISAKPSIISADPWSNNPEGETCGPSGLKWL